MCIIQRNPDSENENFNNNNNNFYTYISFDIVICRSHLCYIFDQKPENSKTG